MNFIQCNIETSTFDWIVAHSIVHLIKLSFFKCSEIMWVIVLYRLNWVWKDVERALNEEIHFDTFHCFFPVMNFLLFSVRYIFNWWIQQINIRKKQWWRIWQLQQQQQQTRTYTNKYFCSYCCRHEYCWRDWINVSVCIYENDSTQAFIRIPICWIHQMNIYISLRIAKNSSLFLFEDFHFLFETYNG